MGKIKLVIELDEEDYRLALSRAALLGGMLDKRLVDAVRSGRRIENIGELSDGYHTFNQLYHQRAVLFACIVNQNKDISWKSFKHSDGKYCFDSNGEWFIVGIDTPNGSYTYHYSKEYWDMFNCQELECGKEWDGHTEADVTRLLALKKEYAIGDDGTLVVNVLDGRKVNRVLVCGENHFGGLYYPE